MASSAEPIEIGSVVDHRPLGALQLLVAVLSAMALLVDGYDVQVMALAVPALARDWALPASSFGLALSAVVIGITVGSGAMGPLGDRYGRKTVLVASMIGTGVATACTALAASPGQFVFWRFLTGLALGAGLPNCAALTAEYAPVARRSLIVGLMNIASPMGAFSAGFVAPPVLDAFGWRGTFLLGGAAPLLVGLAVLVLVPESLKFLVVRRPDDPRIGRILRRLAPELDPAAVRIDPPDRTPRASPLVLLSSDYRARTLLLWGLLGLNLFNLYVLVSWLPTLLQRADWSMTASLRGAVLIQAGGVVGGIVMATFLDRGAARAALLGGFGLAGLCLLLFGIVPNGVGWVILLLLLGAGVSGCQLSLNALSAAYYPPAIKATGVSGGLLIGGIGSIVAPLAGAVLIDRGLATVAILALLAIPSLLCMLGVGLMRREWQAH